MIVLFLINELKDENVIILILIFIFVFFIVCRKIRFPVHVHVCQIFTGTCSVSAKTDLHVITGGRFLYRRSRSLSRYCTYKILLSKEITRKLAMAAIGIRPRVDF